MFRKLLVFVFSIGLLGAQTPPFIGLGDSLGEGVQSAIASDRTQPHGYLNLIATQMGVSFPLSLMSTTFYGVIGSTAGRARTNPAVVASNLAVSGADSGSIFGTLSKTPPASETDLVLEPLTGYSQLSAAQALRPAFLVCWIGNNDVLGAVLAFDRLNATQITPLPTFTANYATITSGLGSLGSKVVYANIPDVTQIGFLFSPQDLQLFLGSSYGLPQGSYTSVVAMMLIKLGLISPNILQNPNWVLDPAEVQTIQTAIGNFNQVITANAAQIHAPVVDVHALFNSYTQNPPVIGGVTLLPRFLGGLLSLDGVHPSDIGHALLANAFIGSIDSFYGMNIPQIGSSSLTAILDADPFVDFQGVLKVRGRPLNGLLETLGPVLGISGNFSNLPGSARVVPSPGIDRAAGIQFMRQYLTTIGRDPSSPWTQADAIQAMRLAFGLK